MGEAILTRFGSPVDPNTPVMKWKLYTEIITENTNWTVPTSRNQEFTVLCFGGGGGHGNFSTNYKIKGYGGGGGGYMNKNTISVAAGQSIPITIGAAGYQGRSGGTTSFASYLSAAGGSAPVDSYSGGNGGSGGGMAQVHNHMYYNGGVGFQFGGGGCAGSVEWHQDRDDLPKIRLGAGGIYGGEGGGFAISGNTYYNNNHPELLINSYTSIHNTSTSRGGIGGRINTNYKVGIQILSHSTNGSEITNTDDIINADFSIINNYANGNDASKGFLMTQLLAFGGGGGYGGKGGNGAVGYSGTLSVASSVLAGGGGGGYCANGGNGVVKNINSQLLGAAGGGGGYGSPGTDGTVMSTGICCGGGGGGYGKGNYGRGSNLNLGATNGCVVIQYYGIAYE